MRVEMIGERTDIPMKSPYKNIPVNGKITLYEGAMKAKFETLEVNGTGTVALTLSGKPDIRFDMKYNVNGCTNETGSGLILPILSQCNPAPFVVKKHSEEVPSGECTMSGSLQDEGLIIQEKDADGEDECISRIEFHLINFIDYFGASLHKQSLEWQGRGIFTFGHWTVILDQFCDIDKRLERAEAKHGYVLTHIGRLHRTNHEIFKPEDAKSAMEMLHWFFSFIAGRRTACVLPTGLHHLGYPLWQQWNMSKSSPVRVHRNWFSRHPPQRCFSAAEAFYKCWQDDVKREWLISALGLYFACNYNSDGIELALSISQITLEMLSCVALLEENSLLSEKQFNASGAAGKLRALLSWLGVNKDIPSASSQLSAFYSKQDAPHAVVDIRNMIIHPTKSNRSCRATVPDMAIYEAWQLNLWYIELTLLKLIGYTGSYNNRIGNPPAHLWDMTP